MTESDFYLAFSYASGIGPKRFTALLSHFKSAENAWKGTKNEYEQIGIKDKTYEKFNLSRQYFDESIHRIREDMKKNNIVYISQNDRLYPEKLLNLERPPIGLFIKGDARLLKKKATIAVVGSRKMTSYGSQITQMFVKELVKAGVVIVSGLAMGVDAIAHRSAITGNGYTIAVLGCGVDVPYPQENSGLYMSILQSEGLILSEYPPHVSPVRGSFPARNRVIAALSKAVLVPEAGIDSGSLITAANASELGLPIFAIPGQITSQQSQGTAYLLQRGATLVTHPSELLQHLHMSPRHENEKVIDFNSFPLSNEEKNVIKLLYQEAMSVDELSKKIKVAVTQVSKIITLLELQGYVKDDGQGKLIANL